MEIVELNKSYTCKDFMYEFSDMLFDFIENSARANSKHGLK